jgi:hypothetical protein
MEKRGVGAAGVGPRVIGRLTPELISKSAQYMSCVNQYELDLRGCRIAMIENLGATEVRMIVWESGNESSGRLFFFWFRSIFAAPG